MTRHALLPRSASVQRGRPSPAAAALVCALLAAAWAPPAAAQVIDRPQGAFRGLFGGGPPPDPNRTSTSLTFAVNALGGYDDNAAVSEGLGPPTELTAPEGGGYTTVLDAALLLFHGRAARAISADVRAALNEYRNVPMPSNRSFSASVSARRDLTRRTNINLSGGGGYVRNFGVDGPITAGAEPGTVPSSPGVFGFGNRPSLNASALAGVDHRWSRRDTTRATYDFTRTFFTDEDGGDSRVHRVTTTYGRQISRSTSIDANYAFGDTNFAFGAGDAGRTLREHRVSGGFDILRRLSARRNVNFNLDGGALRIASVTGTETPIPYEIWTPFVEAGARYMFARSWNLTGTYRRGADTLDGLSNEAFLNDTVNVGVSGLVSSRVELAFATGAAFGSVAAEEARTEYTTALGSVQTRVALTRSLAAVVSYHYYRYSFSNAVLPEGFAPEFDRHAVRVGLSFWLPLYGTTTRQ